DRALRKGKLVEVATLDSIYAPRNPMERGHLNYGYGWRTSENARHKAVYHTGWWHGFRNIYLRQIDEDITIHMLTKLTNSSLPRLDELYKLAGMPVVRRSAYYGNGQPVADDDE